MRIATRLACTMHALIAVSSLCPVSFGSSAPVCSAELNAVIFKDLVAVTVQNVVQKTVRINYLKRPQVVKSHFRLAVLARISTKQIMHLQRSANRTITTNRASGFSMTWWHTKNTLNVILMFKNDRNCSQWVYILTYDNATSSQTTSRKNNTT